MPEIVFSPRIFILCSGGNKKSGDKSSSASAANASSSAKVGGVSKKSDEVSIIPQGKATTNSNVAKKPPVVS